MTIEREIAVNALALNIASSNQIMSDNSKEKVVVITGASSGLGEATARLLSAEGSTLDRFARAATFAMTASQRMST